MNQPAALIEPLNARELKILSLIDDGMSYGEIAQALYIEKATVTWYVQQIYDKLNLEKSQRNHQKALARAKELGLVGSRTDISAAGRANLTIKNPYKGLRSFQQADADEFFGREALIQRLLLRLKESGPMARFLAVVGPSGSGKSSLLHAGLIPALRHGSVPGSEGWVIASMVPGSHPLDELEAALTRVSARSGIDIMAQLQRDERGLQRVAAMLLPENSELLLVIDQFEEVFSQAVDEEQSHQFLSLLGDCGSESHSRVRMVIALRADYYDRPLVLPVINDLFRTRTEVVTPLSADELAQAILMPARQAGVQVEGGLVAVMVDEVSERPGLLPLTQFSLTELFDRRQNSSMTLAIYHQIGGIRGALTRRADVLYESLSVSQQALVRQLFLRLVKLGMQSEVLRRRVSPSELETIGNNSQEVEGLIDQLVGYRLITLDYDPATGSAMVEIAHEALIREWSQLRDWLEDSREDIRQQRLLAAAASDWREANKDSSYLLSGTHLIQFQSWAENSLVELGPAESEFLTTSLHEKQRQDRRGRLLRNLVFGAVVLVAIVMSGLAILAIDRERQAQDARIRAERRTLENRSILLATNAQAAYTAGRTDLALLLANKAVDLTDPPEFSDQIFRTIALGPGIRAVLSVPLHPVKSVSISPDNKIVIAGGCEYREELTCKKGVLFVLNIAGDASDIDPNEERYAVASKELTGTVNDVEFSPYTNAEGRYTVLSACEGGSIILSDVFTNSLGTVINRYDGHAGAVNAVAFSPDGKQFVAAYDQGVIIFWDTGSGQEIQRLSAGKDAITSVAYSRDGKMTLSTSQDGNTLLWDAESKTKIRSYVSSPGVWLSRVAFGPVNEYGRQTVWGLGNDNAVHIWDLATAQEITGIPPASNPYQDIAFTTDGETAALATERLILLRNTGQMSNEQRLMQVTQGIHTSITTLAISTDNTLLVSADEEGNVELWNLPVKNDLDFKSIEGISSLGNSLLFPDGLHLLSSTGSAGSITPTLVKVDLINNTVDKHYVQLPNQVGLNALAIDSSGRYIVVGGGNSNTEDFPISEEPFLWVLDAESGNVLHQLEGHQHYVRAVAISPDGRYALSGSAFTSTYSQYYITAGELVLWDLETGQMQKQFSSYYDVEGIAFSHDGKLAATCTDGGPQATVIVWEVATGEQVQSVPYGCTDIVFSLNDKSILINYLTKSFQNRIVQFNVNSGEIERIFEGLDGPTTNFNISSDERYLVAASQTTAFMWDMKTGQIQSRITLPAPGANTWAILRLSNDNAIIVQDNSDRLIVWHIDKLPTLTDLQIWIVDNRYLRPFTCEERELYEIQPYCDD